MLWTINGRSCCCDATRTPRPKTHGGCLVQEDAEHADAVVQHGLHLLGVVAGGAQAGEDLGGAVVELALNDELRRDAQRLRAWCGCRQVYRGSTWHVYSMRVRGQSAISALNTAWHNCCRRYCTESECAGRPDVSRTCTQTTELPAKGDLYSMCMGWPTLRLRLQLTARRTQPAAVTGGGRQATQVAGSDHVLQEARAPARLLDENLLLLNRTA